MKTNATISQLHEALAIVNDRFDRNIKFKRLEQTSSKRVNFTLTVHESSKPGGRIGHTGRRIAAACWHVHGYLFDALFDIDPKIYIISAGKRITKDGGNWVDRNIGSMVSPLQYSHACECRNKDMKHIISSEHKRNMRELYSIPHNL